LWLKVRRLSSASAQPQLADTTTWPSHEVPMQLHVDFTVENLEELQRHRQRAEDLGARILLDRTADDDEPLYVLADPAGHPFCMFVA
jgi:hypothetical protein